MTETPRLFQPEPEAGPGHELSVLRFKAAVSEPGGLTDVFTSRDGPTAFLEELITEFNWLPNQCLN